MIPIGGDNKPNIGCPVLCIQPMNFQVVDGPGKKMAFQVEQMTQEAKGSKTKYAQIDHSCQPKQAEATLFTVIYTGFCSLGNRTTIVVFYDPGLN